MRWSCLQFNVLLLRNLKARANIYVYSSTLFSGLIFEDENTVPYGDDTSNCMVCDTKSDRPPCFVLRKGPSMPRRNWSKRREEPSIARTADPRPFVTHTGLAVSTALFLLVIIIITHSSSMKGPRLNFHAERELAHPKTTFFFNSPTTVPPRTSSSCLSFFKEASYTQTVLRYRHCTLL